MNSRLSWRAVEGLRGGDPYGPGAGVSDAGQLRTFEDGKDSRARVGLASPEGRRPRQASGPRRGTVWRSGKIDPLAGEWASINGDEVSAYHGTPEGPSLLYI